MEFELAVIWNYEPNKSSLIVGLSDELKINFKDKNYGSDIKSFTIGFVCISPQFEQFFKAKKPRYIRGKKEMVVEGVPFILENSFEYDINLDFETFKNDTEEECRLLLAKEILSSLSIVESMKSKLKDFDLERFKADLEIYFMQEN